MISWSPCIFSSGHFLIFLVLISLLTSITYILIEFRNWKFHLCVGFKWQIFSCRSISWVASVRDQKLSPCQTKPVTAGSKTDPLLPKAEPISDAGGAFIISMQHICNTHDVITIYDFGKGKNCCAVIARERSVVILAGIKLISFTITCIGLCCGFTMLISVLIIEACFCYCWAALTQHQGFFYSSPHQWGGWGYTKSGTQPGQLSQIDPWAIPHHVVSCSACKLGIRSKKGMFGVTAFVFPSHCSMWWRAAFLSMAEHVPVHGKRRMDFVLSFLACAVYALPIKFYLSQPTNSFPFKCSNFVPHPTWEEWASSCVGMSCWKK